MATKRRSFQRLHYEKGAKKYLYLPVFHVVQRRWLEEVEQRLGGG